jgi:hypothetical protein
MPIITHSCAFASCHGTAAGPTGGLTLVADAPTTYANIVGVASLDLPSMVYVKAGDPANSYLQHRIDGDACTLPACTATSCTESMPQGQDKLSVDARDTIRAWIAQGATNQ